MTTKQAARFSVFLGGMVLAGAAGLPLWAAIGLGFFFGAVLL